MTKDERIAELEREVGTIKFNLKETEMELSVCQDIVKRNKLAVDKIRHEICKKIREYIHSEESKVKGMEFVLLLQKLDQIEQGDE